MRNAKSLDAMWREGFGLKGITGIIENLNSSEAL
jgi:hypothetical protein